ncbi:unnamed protein product [Brassicogethes aeneus]|uniref:Zinc carboxypeptidase A 1 n=1 Tax=Brassicogethes aeneus TaxID=1431903 RepID=A0A9P0ARP4_BRAAE|nr:unnamed protein product [Brassicogethes aeneus]
MKTSIVVLIFAIGGILAHKVRYDNHKLYRLNPKTNEALEQLKQLEENDLEIKFWNDLRGKNHFVDILVPSEKIEEFEKFVRGFEIDLKLINTNIQEVIDAEKTNKRSTGMSWTAYNSLETIVDWMDSLATEYPDKVTKITVGKTYEGRDINGVKLSFNSNNTNNAVFIEANIHAREWITSAVVTWILNEFLTSTDAGVRNLAESHDWYIVPVLNVDGFQYTKTTDRMWRKTRTPYGKCYGVDPNRNWGYHWNEGGTSKNPCSDSYLGPAPFSEECTRTTSKYLSTIADKLIGYIGFHSYSQLLLIPYGHSPAHVENYDQLEEIGLKAAKSLAKRYGTQYTVGNIVETIYIASGSSMDWVKGNYKTPVTYTYELRDTGRYGFLLPAKQIIPTAEETLDSLVTMFEEYDAQTKQI